MNDWIQLRPGWERHVIALTRTHTWNIKNTCALCYMPKTLHGVLNHLFFISSFSMLLIIAFIEHCLPIFNFFYYFCSFTKPHSVFYETVTKFASSIFYSLNLDHQMNTFSLQTTLWTKYTYIIYILHVFV